MDNIGLGDISFPIFKLGEIDPITENGITFTLYKKDDAYVPKIIDDKNIPKPTLGLRRLQIPKVNLLRMGNAVYFISDLIKLASGKMWFIDSNGKLFKYKKSTHVPLIFKRVTKILNSGQGTIIEVEGVPTRFKCLFYPNTKPKYAGILVLDGHKYILYGLYQNREKDTHRKI